MLKQEEPRSRFGSEVLQREEEREQPVSLEVRSAEEVSLEVTSCSERRSKFGSEVLEREEK